jgi:hypothetical protein
MVAGSVTDGPVLRRIVGFETGNADTKEGVVWAFPPAMSVSEGDGLGRDGCSASLLVSDLLRSYHDCLGGGGMAKTVDELLSEARALLRTALRPPKPWRHRPTARCWSIFAVMISAVRTG